MSRVIAFLCGAGGGATILFGRIIPPADRLAHAPELATELPLGIQAVSPGTNVANPELKRSGLVILSAVTSQSNWTNSRTSSAPTTPSEPSDPPASPLTANRTGRLIAEGSAGATLKIATPSVFEYNRFLHDWVKDTFENEATYAKVVKNGQVVATFDNGGGMATSDPSLGALLREDSNLKGPASAQFRAEQIAAAIGGEIVKAPTAQTQEEWTPSLNLLERQSSYAAYRKQRLALESRGIQA